MNTNPECETNIDALVASFEQDCKLAITSDFIEHVGRRQLADALCGINNAIRNFPAGALCITTEIIDGLIAVGAAAHRNALEGEE